MNRISAQRTNRLAALAALLVPLPLVAEAPEPVRHCYDVRAKGDGALLLTFDSPPYDPRKTVQLESATPAARKPAPNPEGRNNMIAPQNDLNRRRFLRNLSLGAALFTVPGAFAEEFLRTPRQTEGPFYPDHLPLDTDNDLIIVNDSLTPAVGEITHLNGRILDTQGQPIRNALVEIWQVDNNGVYLHSRDTHAARDKNFQGFGRFLTGSSGEYYFRTIKPVLYPGRTRHIHFAIKMKGHDKWTTQCYVRGEPQNERDGIYREINDPKARAAVTVDFAPIKGSRVGELAAKFDVVLGFTPEA